MANRRRDTRIHQQRTDNIIDVVLRQIRGVHKATNQFRSIPRKLTTHLGQLGTVPNQMIRITEIVLSVGLLRQRLGRTAGL